MQTLCGRKLRNVATAAMLCLVWCSAIVQEVAAQRWPDEHLDPPFFYHADFSLDRYKGLLESVSDLQHEIPKILELSELEEPVHLFLFQRQSTYQRYLKKYFPKVPSRPALFIKQRGPGMVFARLSPQLDVDLRHETAHSVLHGILPMVPLWLDEGLGEYFEVPAVERALGHPHLVEIVRLSQRRVVPQIEKLESIAELAHMHAAHYRDSWAWVHFMLQGPPEAKQVLTAYLKDIEASIPPGRLSTRLRTKVPQLDQAFLQHFQRYQIRPAVTASRRSLR